MQNELEDDSTKRSYSRRTVTSNWDRYEEPEEVVEQIGADFNELVSSAGKNKGDVFKFKTDALSQIKSSLYSRYYAEACNEWRGPSPRLSAWATQLRRNVATVATLCRFDRSGIRTPYLPHR